MKPPAPETDIVSVVIPTYNEEAAIAEVIEEVVAAMETAALPYEIIVVDDASRDKTARIVEHLFERFPRLRLLSHPVNKGGGAARKTGIRAAQGERIAILDGDGTYPAHSIPELVALLESFDQVVGARTSEQGTLRVLRTFAKTFIRVLASHLMEVKIPDLNSGMRALKKSVALKFFHLLPPGHSWVSTITLAFLANEYTVKFVPIEYYPRKGVSSFHPIRDTYAYLGLVIRATMYFRPLKVFMPLSFFILFVGLLSSSYNLFVRGGGLQQSDIIIILASVVLGALGLLADVIVTTGRVR